MNIKGVLSVLLCAVIISVSSITNAITTTTARAFVDSSDNSLDGLVENTSPTSSSATISNPALSTNLNVRSVSTSNGHLATSASFTSFDGGTAIAEAKSTWSETFSATAGSSASFDFFIPGGAIGFEANNSGPLSGGYSIEITLNGTSLFSAAGDVFTAVGSPTAENHLFIDQTGTILSSTFDNDIAQTFGLDGAGFRFGSYGDTLTLAPIDGENVLTYSMSVYVDGSLGETSALASIGDPLNLSQDPNEGATLSFDNVSAVPVPAAAWLFGSGFIGLIGVARRKK